VLYASGGRVPPDGIDIENKSFTGVSSFVLPLPEHDALFDAPEAEADFLEPVILRRFHRQSLTGESSMLLPFRFLRKKGLKPCAEKTVAMMLVIKVRE
jgi:hypothetical protein